MLQGNVLAGAIGRENKHKGDQVNLQLHNAERQREQKSWAQRSNLMEEAKYVQADEVEKFSLSRERSSGSCPCRQTCSSYHHKLRNGFCNRAVPVPQKKQDSRRNPKDSVGT